MESKHKNALIGALLAVVFVMAVGYAAFAQLLTINGTATIDSNWDVHFDPNQNTASPTMGAGGTVQPTGTIAYTSNNTVATLTANLKQPGDEVSFTLKPSNYGSLNAKAQAFPEIVAADDETGTLTFSNDNKTATKGNIQWDIVSFTNKAKIDGAGGSTLADANQDTIVVKASFIGGQNQAVEANQSAKIKITINYQQVA